MSRESKICIVIFLVVIVAGYIIKRVFDYGNIGGLYTAGIHVETDRKKEDVLNQLLELEDIIVTDKKLLKDYYHNPMEGYVFLQYAIEKDTLLHVVFVSEKWNGKTVLVYDAFSGKDGFSELVYEDMKRYEYNLVKYYFEKKVLRRLQL